MKLKTILWIEECQTQCLMVNHINYYLKQFELNVEDLAKLKELGGILDAQDKNALIQQQLMDWLKQEDYFEYSPFFSRIKEESSFLWGDLAVDPMGSNFINGQQYMAQVFCSAGMPYHAFVHWVSHYHQLFRTIIQQNNLTSSELLLLYHKLEKVHFAILAEAYIKTNELNKTVETHSTTEMATPIARITDGILLLPLMGILTGKRARNILQKILDKVSSLQTKVFILDISGVPFVDSDIANYLLKINKAIQLMGCQLIICGISPPVSETIVDLGIDLDKVQTTGNLQKAISMGLRLTDMRIIRIKKTPQGHSAKNTAQVQK